MLKLAVIGKDVSQSLSPKMHKFILSQMGVACEYDAVSIPPEEFSSRIEEVFEKYDGFNVTIPFKADTVPFLERLQGDALFFGVVNTVRAKERTGDNTDGYGFLLMLENAGVEIQGKRILVLGAGGAGRSCIKKLTEAGADVYAFERDFSRLQKVYEEFGSFTPLKEVKVEGYDILLNCTGIGMHQTVGQTPSVTWAGGAVSPVGKELISLCDTAVDLIYVPAQSEFLRLAAESGKRTVNGEAMLFYQAYMGDCIFLNRKSDSAEAKRLFEEYKNLTEEGI